MRPVELLLPAGDLQKLKLAYAYGADAVYAGMPQFSLRARENGFNEKLLAEGIAHARALGKKFFLTANILPHNEKIITFLHKLDQIMQLKPDAFIMADPGMIMLLKDKYPEAEIHLSVQANTSNWAAAKFWYQNGVRRIILSREVSIDQIKEIKDKVPELEIENFVHGAICMAQSGRCLLSNYFNRRDANQGTCTNSCRWNYKLFEEQGSEYRPLKGTFYLEETQRPGEMMLVDEDEYGTYIMNAKDLMAIDHLQALYNAGVDSFKIEGRTKSLYYLAMVTRAYRAATDDVLAGRPFNPQHIDDLNKLPHRGYTAGFLNNTPGAQMQRYVSGTSDLFTAEYAAYIANVESGRMLLAPKNKISIGDKLSIITPDKSFDITVDTLILEDGSSVQSIHGGAGKSAWINTPENFNPEFAVVAKHVMGPGDPDGEQLVSCSA